MEPTVETIIAIVVGLLLLAALARGYFQVARSLFWGEESIQNIERDTEHDNHQRALETEESDEMKAHEPSETHHEEEAPS